ncbi:vascular endothelial growth factor receptor 1 [Rhinophrynus dorsalis]
MLGCGTVVMLWLLFGCLLLTGRSSAYKLNAPVLNIKGEDLVVQAGQTIHLTCSGDRNSVWTFPAMLSRENKRLSISEKACERYPRMVCSRNLTVSKAHPNDTGLYTCTTATKNRKSSTSVYIFVTDAKTPFVEMYSDIPHVIHMTEGEELVIPCRVTSPNITVTFKKTFENERFTPDGKNIIWDNKRGFIIPKPTYVFIGMLSCEVTVDGIEYSTKYMTNRESLTIHSVQLNVSSSIYLLKNEYLAIACSVTTDLNARAEIEWKYPGKEFRKIASIRREMVRNPKEIVFRNILTIHKVGKMDKGQYTCTAKNGPSMRSVNTTVHIHARPFINVKPLKEGVLEAVAGQKSYNIAMKVRAFPEPEVKWFKDGLLAADKCARYIVKDSSLNIKEVAEEDAGKYTIMVQLKQWNLTKNLTVTLIVNVKPHIYETSVTFQKPYLYPLGSKQSLTCTVYSIPPPKIAWYWHPCPHKHSKAKCDLRSDNTRQSIPLTVGRNSSHDNTIQSITEHTQMIEGKNKTAGILIIDDSRTSGVYTCVASNKLGTERREIKYYVSDTPSGFHINLNKAPTEGDDFTLSCSVNRFLYTDIAWILRRTVGNQTIHHSIGKQRNSITTDNSITLTVTIKNATPADSGTYICRAKNIYNGDFVQRKKQIVISGEHSSKKTNVSWTSRSKTRRRRYTTQSMVTH